MHQSLQRLTIIVLALTFGLLALGQYATARWWYMGAVDVAEHRDAIAHARLAGRTLKTQLNDLRRSAADDAAWDETYRFMQGHNEHYLEANWLSGSFKTLDVTIVALVDTEGRMVAARGYDASEDQYYVPGAPLAQALSSTGVIGAHAPGTDAASGIAMLNGSFFAWGAGPITPTAGGDASHALGKMFLLRPLSPGFEASLAGLTDATIVLHAVRAWDARRPAGAPRELAAADIAFDDHDQTQIVTSFPIAPLGDGRDLVVEMTNARPVHARALEVASALLWSTIATGALVALLTLLFFQRYLLRPLRGIASRLVEIGHGGDAAARLPPPARADEIGTVTDAANEMLGQLEEAKRGADSARDAAVTANRIKSDFLARMSHEIRTPMNGVLGMTELLTRTDLSARQRKFADTIHRSAVSLLEIINDILDFSKIEAKRLELSPSLAEPGNLVEEVLELLAPRAHARGLEFVLEITPAVPTVVEIDRVRIGQVLTNLVGNAIKFTEQGEIAVKVDATSCGDGRASIAFTVRDTGIGIEAAALQRIFEPFSQADASTTQRFGGTGLGLPIARQLVELMGGTLSVVSEPSRGSTFSFNIVVPVQPDRRAPGECDLPLLRDINILVADPNASCRDILQRQLTAQGARVVVSDGADLQAAAAALAGAPLHVALVDPGHPSAGRGLLEAVLSIPAFDAASIIAIASHADTVAGIEATGQPRLAAYLTKPVRRSLLFTTLARLIGREREVATRALLGGGGGAASAESIGLNVLVVEDNLVNQQVTVGMLQLLSCTSTVAANGAEALERIAAGGFDVVLMDCQMPVLDGIEATRRLRADEAARRARRLPVIGVSAHAVQSAHEDCLRAGMTDFIPKPFTLAELSRALKRHAHQRPISLALKTGGR